MYLLLKQRVQQRSSLKSGFCGCRKTLKMLSDLHFLEVRILRRRLQAEFFYPAARLQQILLRNRLSFPLLSIAPRWSNWLLNDARIYFWAGPRPHAKKHSLRTIGGKLTTRFLFHFPVNVLYQLPGLSWRLTWLKQNTRRIRLCPRKYLFPLTSLWRFLRFTFCQLSLELHYQIIAKIIRICSVAI